MAVPRSLPAVLSALRCPLCGRELALSGSALRCPQRHTFNIARQGYLSLLADAKARSGDDDAMMIARDRFLGSGAYAPLRDAIVQAALGESGGPQTHRADGAHIVDAGSGSGYYLAGVLAANEGAETAGWGFGFDSAVRGARLTAKCHPRAVAATWDAFRPFPLADRCADIVLDIFSPRNPSEFARVLAPGGRLVVAHPRADHLAELRAAVPDMVGIDPEKERRLHAALDPLFTEDHRQELAFEVALTPDRAADLIGMTPSARHVSAADRSERLAAEGALPAAVTAAVTVSRWEPR